MKKMTEKFIKHLVEEKHRIRTSYAKAAEVLRNIKTKTEECAQGRKTHTASVWHASLSSLITPQSRFFLTLSIMKCILVCNALLHIIYSGA